MFYPDLITSIKPSDKVLEIGPGGTPHFRSDEFLELKFHSTLEEMLQRGNVEKSSSFGDRPVHYYDGGEFPFKVGQFDYIICSHVIVHVANPAEFLAELFRVSGGRGYLEYPLITYEYLYNFDVHLNFVKFDFDEMILRYLPKSETAFHEFSPVTSVFRESLVRGWDDLCAANKKLFFEGFEFNSPFRIERANSICQLVPDNSAIGRKSTTRRRANQILNKLGL